MTSSTNTRSTAVSFQQCEGFRNAKNERAVVDLPTKGYGLGGAWCTKVDASDRLGRKAPQRFRDWAKSLCRHEPPPVLNSMCDDSNNALERSLAQERTDCIYALLVCDLSH